MQRLPAILGKVEGSPGLARCRPPARGIDTMMAHRPTVEDSQVTLVVLQKLRQGFTSKVGLGWSLPGIARCRPNTPCGPMARPRLAGCICLRAL